jgi:hypothetical protein
MPDDTLIMLLDEVRSKTLRFVQGVSDEEARWTPPDLHNSILWHAGHCYILAEWLALGAIGRNPEAPAHWFETFSWQSQPTRVSPVRWPSLDEVIARLADQHSRLRRVIGDLSEDQLFETAAGNPGRTVRFSILHALHDEACHCGEILLLRKLQGLGRPARAV